MYLPAKSALQRNYPRRTNSRTNKREGQRLRKKHLGRLNEGVCTPEMTVAYTEILHNLERIGDCCAHIAVFVLEHQKDSRVRHAVV